MRFSTSELAAQLGGELVGPDVTVDGASIDSRTALPGQLYVPIVAERDGHAFIAAALDAGVAAYLTMQQPVGGTAVVVADTSSALMDLGLLARSAQFVKCASGHAFIPRIFAHSLYYADAKLLSLIHI